VQNYRFALADRIAIVEWINTNLEVSWAVLPQVEVHSAEVTLIRENTPLLNLQGNPRALPELLPCDPDAASLRRAYPHSRSNYYVGRCLVSILQ